MGIQESDKHKQASSTETSDIAAPAPTPMRNQVAAANAKIDSDLEVTPKDLEHKDKKQTAIHPNTARIEADSESGCGVTSAHNL